MFCFEKRSKTPLYQQLYEQVRVQITNGTLVKGQKLWPTRELAAEYHLSRNTVIQAYNQLEVEGYIRSVIGSGCYVEAISPPDSFGYSRQTESAPFRKSRKAEKLYDFSYGDLDYNCYRSGAWRKCLLEAYEILANQKIVPYSEPQGLWELRHALANYLQLSRGVCCSEDQIILTEGHQQSLALAAKIFFGKNRSFAMEDPGYNGTRAVMQQNGISAIPVPLEPDGISIDAVQRLSGTLLYITPSHQFPMGSVLPIAKRLSLLQWAEQSDSYILEDDYDSELRYHSLPIPSLQSIDRNDRTIYMGTFSKSLSPDLRVAYIVLPRQFVSVYQKAFPHANCGVPTLIQSALARFIRSGEYQKHKNIMRTYYQKKHDHIVKFFDEKLPGKASLLGENGGLHFILALHESVDRNVFIERCAAEKVCVYPVEPFWIDRDRCPQDQFLLGFGALPLTELPLALETLCGAICDAADYRKEAKKNPWNR